MAPRILVFDLDGTLIDTAPDLVDTLNVVFAAEGLPPVPYSAARKLVGGGMKVMIARGLAAEGRAVEPALLDRLYADFLTYYGAHIADRSRPFPGLVDALDVLQADGWRFAVCTNKLERLATQLLDTLGLAPRFAAICGQDTFGVPKPDPEILRRTIAAAGGTAAGAVMVGDSETDIRTARAAGAPIIAVDFGYSDRSIATLGADEIISDFAQLPVCLSGILAAQ